MSNNGEDFTTTTDQVKQQNNRLNLSKFESDLFDEAKSKPEPIIRVKRIKLPNDGENWKIFKDDEVIFLVEGLKLSKKERIFLRTIEGVSLLMKEAKSGIRSLNSLKKEINKYLGV